MNSTLTNYRTTLRPLTALVEAVPAGHWSNASPCEGWTARDVLGHMIETQRAFLTGHGVDLGAPPDLADPAAAWGDHTKRVVEAICEDTLTSSPYEGHFGPTTIGATLEQFYVWDMLVHRWDIARSAGKEPQLSELELDRIEAGAESFGPALYMEGVCHPAVDAPTNAPREARVMARLGRRP